MGFPAGSSVLPSPRGLFLLSLCCFCFVLVFPQTALHSWVMRSLQNMVWRHILLLRKPAPTPVLSSWIWPGALMGHASKLRVLLPQSPQAPWFCLLLLLLNQKLVLLTFCFSSALCAHVPSVRWTLLALWVHRAPLKSPGEVLPQHLGLLQGFSLPY